MTDEKLIENINLFDKETKFISITDSNSGAILKHVIAKDNDYFLKIIDKTEVDIERLKHILDIYSFGKIKSLKLLQYGYIDNKVYLIYNWIDGHALNCLYDSYELNDYYDMGFKIGENYAVINELELQSQLNKNYSVAELARSQKEKFEDLYYGKLSYIKNIMGEEFIEPILMRFIQLSSSFDNEQKVYIHEDMHPKNVMYNDELYIIDVEGLCIDYFAMNLRWSIAAAFNNQKNLEYFKGFINGFYADDVPYKFYDELTFILIINFLDHIIEFSETKEEGFIKNYVNKFKMIFDNVDIYNTNNIFLNTTIYN